MASNKVVQLAWTVAVDVAELGARYEAWYVTKEQIEEINIQHTLSKQSRLHCLPGEVIHMIATEIRESAYIGRIDGWQYLKRCCDAECPDEDHFPQNEEDIRAKAEQLPLQYSQRLRGTRARRRRGHYDHYRQVAIDSLVADNHKQSIRAWVKRLKDLTSTMKASFILRTLRRNH